MSAKRPDSSPELSASVDHNQSLGEQPTLEGCHGPSSAAPPAKSVGEGSTAEIGSSIVEDLAAELGDDAFAGLELVDLAPRYRIERELGIGGMGRVSQAFDTLLGRKVAVSAHQHQS